MSRALLRPLLFAAVALAAWQAVRVGSILITVLVRNRPLRIGDWFRLRGAVHSETYRDERRYAIEQSRAGEEGWRVVSEERGAHGIVAIYERYEPALGYTDIDPIQAEDTRT